VYERGRERGRELRDGGRQEGRERLTVRKREGGKKEEIEQGEGETCPRMKYELHLYLLKTFCDLWISSLAILAQ